MGIFSLAIFKLFTYYKNSKIGMIIKSNISTVEDKKRVLHTLLGTLDHVLIMM
jgi:hypothetical protein